MSDFKTRLLEERDQLDERTTKLKAFLDSDGFSKIDNVQGRLLMIQYSNMHAYLGTLNMRIALLK